MKPAPNRKARRARDAGERRLERAAQRMDTARLEAALPGLDPDSVAARVTRRILAERKRSGTP
jgi:hypothetical protein